MISTCIQLADIGFLAGIGGNLAVRVDESHMVVTPSASDYYSMKPDDLCLLHIQSLKMLEGTKQPTTESGIHSSFFQKRPEIQVSLHTHQPLASAITLMGKDLPLHSMEAKRNLGEKLLMVPYAPSGTSFLIRAFRNTITKDHNGYLLKNHGVVCGAKDLKAAVLCAQWIEEEAIRFLHHSIESNLQKTTYPISLQKQIESVYSGSNKSWLSKSRGKNR